MGASASDVGILTDFCLNVNPYLMKRKLRLVKFTDITVLIFIDLGLVSNYICERGVIHRLGHALSLKPE